jgi:hypothetical protein
MPLITHDTDNVPGSGDMQGLLARVAEFADHLAKLDAQFGRLSTVSPGPPGNQNLVASIQRIMANANHVAQVAGNWMQGAQQNNTPVP